MKNPLTLVATFSIFIANLTVAHCEEAKPTTYPYAAYHEGKLDPQLTGWPLTDDERAYVVNKPEHDRRPGRESNKHLPALWPQYYPHHGNASHPPIASIALFERDLD